MINLLAQAVVLLAGIWLIGVSILMLTKPVTALALLAKMASTNLINYTELGLRLLCGAAVIEVANGTSYATAFLAFGWMLVLTAVVLMLIPRTWHSRYAVYWSNKLSPAVVRGCAPFSLLLGVFAIYALWD